MPKAPAANVKKNYENKESWTPGAGTPPEPTDTPRDAAQAEATDQPTHHEQPRRPQSKEAKRGQAAATRSAREMPTDTGTRDTASANQPKTRDHPNTRTTAAAEGNGQGTEEPAPNMRQSYEKKQHEARKNEKKTHATSRKPTRKRESQHPQHNRQSHHRRRPRPTPNEPPRTPPIFEIQRPPRQKLNEKTKDRAGEAAGRRRLGQGAVLGMSRGQATRPPAANAPLWLGREPTKFPWGFCKVVCASGPARSEASHNLRVD